MLNQSPRQSPFNVGNCMLLSSVTNINESLPKSLYILSIADGSDLYFFQSVNEIKAIKSSTIALLFRLAIQNLLKASFLFFFF